MAVNIAQQLAGIQSPVDRIQQGIMFGQQQQDRRTKQEAAQAQAIKQQEMDEQVIAFVDKPNKTGKDYADFGLLRPDLIDPIKEAVGQMEADEKEATINEAINIFAALENGNQDVAVGLLEDKLEAAKNSGDPDDIRIAEGLLLAAQSQPDAAKSMVGAMLSIATGDKFGDVLDRLQKQGADREIGFEEAFHTSLKENLPADQREKADLIKLGLVPKATTEKIIKQGGLYGKADPATNTFIPLRDANGNTISVSQVAAGEAEIEGAKSFAKAKGADRNKFITEGATTIQGINQNNRNIDLAIDALNKGAATGFVQSFFPSIRAASVELGNVRNRLGLDVIGSVRFGALSEGERQMAMETAIPTDMLPADLIKWLERKKTANDKMLGYFGEQIDFLSKGGDIAGFLKKKTDETKEDNLPQGAKVIQTLKSGARVIELEDGTRKVLE